MLMHARMCVRIDRFSQRHNHPPTAFTNQTNPDNPPTKKKQALVVAPGGMGTLDELFEVLTLKQTGKVQPDLPVVLFGKAYWKSIINWQVRRCRCRGPVRRCRGSGRVCSFARSCMCVCVCVGSIINWQARRWRGSVAWVFICLCGTAVGTIVDWQVRRWKYRSAGVEVYIRTCVSYTLPQAPHDPTH